jgi:hypothetical protein
MNGQQSIRACRFSKREDFETNDEILVVFHSFSSFSLPRSKQKEIYY